MHSGRNIPRNLCLYASVLIALGAASTATAASVTFVNRSGVDIHQIYLSPVSLAQWGPGRLRNWVLQNGQTYKVEAACGNYDVRLVGEDERDSCVVPNQYLCANEHAVITEKALMNCAEATGSQSAVPATRANSSAKVTVGNQSGHDIHELLISPASQSRWGPDELRGSVLRSGQAYTLEMSCGNYDVRFFDEVGDYCMVQNLYMCGTERANINRPDPSDCDPGYGD